MDAELKNLRIDRSKRRGDGPSRWATIWILTGIALLLGAGGARYLYNLANTEREVDVVRVHASSAAEQASTGDVILNATGYIVAAHKIELASKVMGKVAWIGVEKGDRVREGQDLVRLEDDEYRAQVQQSRGNLQNLQAKLEQALNGSRPEEISKAKADLDSFQADLVNAKVTLDRTRNLVEQGVLARQNLDDAQARYDGQVAKVASIDRTFALTKLGPRKEEIDAIRGQIEQAKGSLAYGETQLASTVIRAPISGTILERNVEKGEFVTTGFVGDKGAKGYVVSMANLGDLQAELDIGQSDFAKLGPHQKAIATAEAFPDRHYEAVIEEVAPEANRQKATVQVKVRILRPDEYLRPEMNASVAFLAEKKSRKGSTPAPPSIWIPASAVRDGSVFVIASGRAVKRKVKTGPTMTLSTGAPGVRVEEGLIGGEDIIAGPPADLKDGDRVKAKG